jgi:predicted nucleotidyltransferase
MLYAKVFRALQDHQVRYLLVGGVAVNLHGFARATADLDIVIALDGQNVNRFLDAVKAIGWSPRVPVQLDDFADAEVRNRWVHDKRMKVFTVFNSEKSTEELDVLLEYELDFEMAYRNREIVSAGGMDISLIGLDDLLALKKQAGRQRDQIDIQALERIRSLKIERQDEPE